MSPHLITLNLFRDKEGHKYDRSQMVTFELFYNTNDASPKTYSMQLIYFGVGNPKQYLDIVNVINKPFRSQAVTSLTEQCEMSQIVLNYYYPFVFEIQEILLKKIKISTNSQTTVE